MSKSLSKHLKQCTSPACGEIHYVLNDSASERSPEFCPFCGSESTDYNPPSQKDEDNEDS